MALPKQFLISLPLDVGGWGWQILRYFKNIIGKDPLPPGEEILSLELVNGIHETHH
jgi:hypothetical protein